MEFLKRTFAYGLSKSRNLPMYSKIASDTSVSVKTVYKLAHGRHSKNAKESEAKSELLRLGILWQK